MAVADGLFDLRSAYRCDRARRRSRTQRSSRGVNGRCASAEGDRAAEQPQQTAQFLLARFGGFITTHTCRYHVS